jgi:nitrogen fixation/metabolism regulation signal transduction histidine kinase
MSETATLAQRGGRRQRKLRNFLLDSHFQLKYTSYLVLIALALSISLGAVLWRTSQAMVAQSRQNVERGEQIVTLSKEVVGESRKVSAVVRMNIVRDPVYQDNPDLLAAFNADAENQDHRLASQQAKLEEQRKDLAEQSGRLAHSQSLMLWTLVGVLAVLVFAVGAAGIIVTHKVAGPIFKMKRQLAEVAEGQLKLPSPLRKGDELVEFHQSFRDMVQSLRDQRERQIAALDSSIAALDGAVDAERMAELRRLRQELQSALG